MRDWVVGSALIESDEGLLLVQNRRRDGRVDWSPPGGVIDEGETILEGLAREVEEETGLVVKEWADGPLYEVTAVALDLNWVMRCEVHRAVAFEGELHVDDPDGIVVDAAFGPADQIEARLGECFHWVREPLAEWLLERWEPAARRGFHYDVRGSSLDPLEVVRAPNS